MSTPDDYRAMAEEYFRWARQAQTEDKRQAYLDVARTWLEAASGQDCGVAAQSEALMGAVLIAVLPSSVSDQQAFSTARSANRARIRILATRRGESFLAGQKLRLLTFAAFS
jgi:Lon protease-like protein